MQCIGLFGGTFDPIHYGHLRTAYELLHKLRLDEVRFIPCARPPHRSVDVTPSDLRVRMLASAIAAEPGFVIDERELARAGPSYTVDTLTSVRAEYPHSSLCLLLGMDAFLDLPSWHEWGRLLDLAHLVVAHRPGWQVPREGALGALLDRHQTDSPVGLRSAIAGRIHVEPVTQLEVSSTDLRRSIRDGIKPKYLLPKEVLSIIVETECYGTTTQD
jgi:nicotinate-nucleotide adenylyltransferase